MMTITPIETMTVGETTYAGDLLGEARAHLGGALDFLTRTTTPGGKPIATPDRRMEALRLAREAAEHVEDALQVEAPTEAIRDMRHALEEMYAATRALDAMAPGPVDPGGFGAPAARLQAGIVLLNKVEALLNDPTRIGIP